MDSIVNTRDPEIANQENQQNAQHAFLVLELNVPFATIVVVMMLVNQKIQSRTTEMHSMMARNEASFAVGPGPLLDIVFIPTINMVHTKRERMDVNNAMLM